MMSRKMLIISNPGEFGAENYCEGVNQDVIRYREFFTSIAGGAWESHEISTLNRPFPYEVDIALKNLVGQGYSMVIFCGHGYSRPDGTTMVELREGCTYDSRNFHSGSNKHTVILDCCRVVWDGLLEHAQPHLDFHKNFGQPISKTMARARFDYAVSQCFNGTIILYACDNNESAEDDSRNGGIYSHALRSTAIEWSKSISETKTLSIVAAHNYASVKVQSISNNQQNPQIIKPRFKPYFPFAVSMYY